MSTVTEPKVISLEGYLDTSYSPDCEFVDGAVVERELGERPHSRTQGNIHYSLRHRYPNVFVWLEQRVQTTPRRCRVPDVCVTLNDPMEDVFISPPLICIEILSQRDEIGAVTKKLAEYRAFGVTHIWLFDPRRKKAYFYDGTLREVTGKTLTAPEAGIELPLDAVFEGL